jgi:flagellar hook assembly protein FlgD
VIKDRKKIVRTLDVTAVGASVTASWDGTLADGTRASAGTYTWELTAAPADGTGPGVTLTGTFTAS